MSMTEAEYVAKSEALRQAIFLRYLWCFVFLNNDVGCTVVEEVNIGALHQSNNPVATPNSTSTSATISSGSALHGESLGQYISLSKVQHADF